MIEGICPRCGNHYYGWILVKPEYRVCTCGGKLRIRDRVKLPAGYVVYRADQSLIDMPPLNSCFNEN